MSILFLSLALTDNQEYLLGATSDGELYVWLFESILFEHLTEKLEGENIYNNICHFKLKAGKIFNLKPDTNNLNRLFFNDDYFFYSCKWSDLLEEIKQRQLLNYPGTSSDKFKENFAIKLNISQDSGEAFQKITSVDYDLKGKRCFGGTDKGNIFIIDLEKFTTLKLMVPNKGFGSLEMSPCAITAVKYYKEDLLVFGNSKGLIRIWSYENDREIKTLKLDKDTLGAVKCIETDKDARWLVVGHNDYITRWHLESGVLDSVMPTVTGVNALLVGSMSIFSAHDCKYLYQWNEAGEAQAKAETSNTCITTLIGDVEGKQKIMISAGNGPLVDVYINANRVISFLG